MAQINPQNERLKRQYLGYLKEADGKDEKTLDQVAASLRDFELALNLKPFKSFHRDWGRKYKTHLERCRNRRTGRQLSLTTREARLRNVRAFFKWLAGRPGFRSRMSYEDVDYFNSNRKEARAAHAGRPIAYPSMEQCAHAFRLMPEGTLIQKRDRAVFALLMLTGMRVGALATVRLKHIDLVEGYVYQDGREVQTKNGKPIETWFLPIDEMYLMAFEGWFTHLRETLLFGPGDAVYPKPEQTLKNGRFIHDTLSRNPYCNSQKITATIKAAFRTAGLQEFTPHSFRKTLSLYADQVCDTHEEFKAFSQNLGHSNETVTISSYLPVSRERQRDLIRKMGRG